MNTPRINLTKTEKKAAEVLVEFYLANQKLVQSILDSALNDIQGSDSLMKCVHSIRSRVKDPEHLRDKLFRKLTKAKETSTAFSVTKENLFEEINDLAGIRLIHLHTDQFSEINQNLNKIIEDSNWVLVEKPKARTWDNERTEYFQNMGIECIDGIDGNMYTSVHYVVSPNMTAKVTCEIQVRTLAEEIWGEVDHAINYPHKTENFANREQLKVLARVTSSCTRLVDAIYRTEEESASKQRIKPKP
jgi:putative GTP pyrophosphokinase